jgi:hypothetical protein
MSSSTERSRRRRDRLRGLLDLDAAHPCLSECARLVYSLRTDPYCSVCWRSTPAGRLWNRQRMARARAARPA